MSRITSLPKIYNIPLPHLGYGFDANNDPIELTVNNVTESYDENGSKRLFDDGFVERREELITNGGFDTDTDWIKESIATISGGVGILTANGGNVGLRQINLWPAGSFEGKVIKVSYTVTANTLNAGDLWLNGWNVSDFAITAEIPQTIGTHAIYAPVKVGDSNSITFRIESASATGSISIDDISASTPEIIPNKPDKTPAYPLESYDTLINGTNFLNASNFMLDMSRPNGTESEEMIDGDFPNGTTAWTFEGGWTGEDGFAQYSGVVNSDLIQNGLTANETYILSYKILETSIDGDFKISGLTTPAQPELSKNTGTYNKVFKTDGASPTDLRLRVALNTTGVLKITNISVKIAALEILFFDKSNTLIWKDAVRASDYFNGDNPFLWHSSELTQEFIYNNIQDDYKYMWWNRIINNQFEDLFFFGTARTGAAICLTKNYVQLGEEYETADATHYVCPLDKAI